LLVVSCDLFNNKPEIDLLKAIDDKVAWANAPWVTVSVAALPGSVNTITPSVTGQKKGYAFTVSFTPNPAWYFCGWDAVLSADAAEYLSALDKPESTARTVQMALAAKTASLVKIELPDSGEDLIGTAKITVDTTESVTLIPGCVKRPFVTGNTLPNNFVDQRVRNFPIHIYFSHPVDDSCLNFTNFRITASDYNGNDQGDISQYYDKPLQTGNRVTITKKPDNTADGTDMSGFAFLNITVSLNAAGLTWTSEDTGGKPVAMDPGGAGLELSYSVNNGNSMPAGESVMASIGIDGGLVGDEWPGSAEEYYMTGAERTVYLLFDKKALDDSIMTGYQYGIRFNGLVKITEKGADGTVAEAELNVIDGSAAGLVVHPEYTALAGNYRESHPENHDPYIAKHKLLTNHDGVITFAVQPLDSQGICPSYTDAKKVGIILQGTPVSVPAAPAAPVGLAATGSAIDRVSLSWNAVESATGYRVYRSSSQNGDYFNVSGNLGSNSYTDTGLAPNAAYWYKVSAYNSVDEGARSDAVSKTTLPAVQRPAIPTGLKATGNTINSVSLSWNAVSGAAGYRVYRSNFQDGTYTQKGSDLQKTTFTDDTELQANTTYWYKVSAYNSEGESGMSAAISRATTPPAAPPDTAPSNFRAASGGENSITHTWDVVNGAKGYRLYRSGNGSSYARAADLPMETSYTDTGLTANTTYWYMLSALNSAGEGPQTSAVSRATAPVTPTGLSADSTANSVSLLWNTVPGAAGYLVYRSTDSINYYPQNNGIAWPAPPYPDTTDADKTYWYRVSAVNADGDASNRSGAVQTRTLLPGNYYVRESASGGFGTKDGSSWANASGNLQAMIEAAYAYISDPVNAGKEAVVHVGAGTYTPQYTPSEDPAIIALESPTPDSRDNAFLLRPGVKLRGGYINTGEDIDEAARQARFYTYAEYLEDSSKRPGEVRNDAHKAVLSGNLGSAKVYHVVLGVNIPANSGTELDGFTIQDGNAGGSSYLSVGGKNFSRLYGSGIYNISSSPVLKNLSITGNGSSSSSGGGGGMYNNTSSSPTLNNITIRGNTSALGGGGLENHNSPVTLNNVVITGNSRVGIHNVNNSTLSLTNVSITGNTSSSDGGGIYNFSSTLTMTDVNITGNTSSSSGGGIYSTDSSPLTLNRVTIAGNKASSAGGGICNSSSSAVTLTNVCVTGNSAGTWGGGIYTSTTSASASLTLTNVTIAGNYGGGAMSGGIGSGGGIHNGTASVIKPQIWNSIIWGNRADTGMDADIAGGVIINFSMYKIHCSDYPETDYTDPKYTLETGGEDHNLTGAAYTPKFVFFQQASANTPALQGDFHLDTGSAAINAGYNGYFTASPKTDLDGNSRIVGGKIDMGAYEFQ
jgi:fibronectin type 3 domain-containing protein